MSNSPKDSARVQWEAIMNDPAHPFHSRLATEAREAAIREVLRLNTILVGSENVESN